MNLSPPEIARDVGGACSVRVFDYLTWELVDGVSLHLFFVIWSYAAS